MDEGLSDLSKLLGECAAGRAAADELLPALYQELRRLAEARLRRLPPGQTLQPTALVHETYLALVGNGDPLWAGRAHFFGAAAKAMNEVLIDLARKKGAKKRNGGVRPASLDAAEFVRAAVPAGDDVLAVSEAVKRLEAEHGRQAQVFLLRTLAGQEDGHIAEMLGLSVRTVERDFRFAKAYLARELST